MATPLIDPRQGQLVPDILGAQAAGLQLQQTRDLAPLQLQQQRLGLQESQLGLQKQQQTQVSEQNQATLSALISGATQLKGITDPQGKVSFLQQQRDQFAQAGLPTQGIDQALALANQGNFQELETQTDRLIALGQEPPEGFTLKPAEKRFIGQKLIAEGGPKPIELSSVQKKVAAEGLDPNSPAGQARARELNQRGATDPSLKPGDQQIPQIPPSLIADLPESLAQQASDAFTVAGGGTDGLKAVAKIIDKGNEQQRRLLSPQLIKNSFPKASPAEQIQLQAAMDAAKTTESGFKSAGKVRTEQRRLKKAKIFQNRTVELLNNILENPELNDVIGSIEGTDKGFLFGEKIRSDGESEVIADIKEAESLLTADNLDLMSGVLSETDIQILIKLASGALVRTRGEARFIKDVTSLRDRLSSQLVQTADDTANDRQKGTQQPPATPPSGREGGELMIDAQGNKAFVFPDGTVEEVQ